MNGFANKGLDEGDFGGPSDSSGFKAVKAFDAFPKTKASYTQRSQAGGIWTVVLVVASVLLTFSEMRRWWAGETRHSYSVEKGVGHDLQMNIDIVVAMKCDDLHVNIQDVSGDRIIAGAALKKDPTSWLLYNHLRKGRANWSEEERAKYEEERSRHVYKEDDVHDYIGAAGKGKKFPRTPVPTRRTVLNSCRIYGSLHGNKVQGDFHITARGHGYTEFAQHLDHNEFNFSHVINELSFGPFYPSLVNPLDNTFATTDVKFQKYQYYLSIVPTIYTVAPDQLLRGIGDKSESPSSGEDGLSQHPLFKSSKNTVFTNQYAVTEQSRQVDESNNQVPGLFIKYDIEPIMLLISEDWATIPAMLIRIINIVSGILVAGGWCYQLTDWANAYRSAKQRGDSMGMLHGAWNEKV